MSRTISSALAGLVNAIRQTSVTPANLPADTLSIIQHQDVLVWLNKLVVTAGVWCDGCEKYEIRCEKCDGLGYDASYRDAYVECEHCSGAGFHGCCAHDGAP